MANAPTFSEALGRGVLVFDGAMGSEIYRRHVFTNRSFDELCLADPCLVEEIHRQYCEAGADVLTTNTFGANRLALARYGLAEKVCQINRAGAAIARRVADQAGRPVLVAGSIGPLPPPLDSRVTIDELIAEQVTSLREGGADLVIFETQPSRAALEQCATAMRRMPEVPYLLSFILVDQAESAAGEPVEAMLAPLPADGPQPAAWGLNCGTGPDGLLPAVERAVRASSLPLVVQPNAGMPKEVENRRIYLCSPEYLTSYARRFVSLGVAAVGGCCGTTPEHIRELARAIKPLARARIQAVVRPAESAPAKPPAPMAEKSELGRRLAGGQWVTTVELLPPRGYNLDSTVAKSRTLHDRGVTAINIPDGPRASARISPLVTAERIQRVAGIETILHFCCRDRNLIGMQADLLACAACGLRNILFVTGDPPKLGDYPHATGVFDADSVGMVVVQQRLNCGLDLGGQAIDPQTFALIGVGLDPTALDRRRELERFRRKIAGGAEFAISQPVFDPDALLRMLDEVQDCGIPILAGIWPLSSYRNALFMRNEVPGVVVPDAVMERMAAATSREEQLATGIQIARESAERVRPRVAGIQVSAPLGNIETAWSVIRPAGEGLGIGDFGLS
ncbi:MAG: bifunctional homocysteine S-methyltransferase/methylenetetrahydrofolate reductase [Thermoguttaceae bacterium]|jgi:homocysteine S-methyltransferase